MLGMFIKANMLNDRIASADRRSPWWVQLLDVLLHMCKPSEYEALCVCTEHNGMSSALLGLSIS